MIPDGHKKGQFPISLAEYIKKPKKNVAVLILSYCLGQYCGEKSFMPAGCIVCIVSLLPFVFSLSLFCFTLNSIYVRYFKLFSRFHFEMDVQLSCTECISKIIYISKQSLMSQVLFRSQH